MNKEEVRKIKILWIPISCLITLFSNTRRFQDVIQLPVFDLPEDAIVMGVFSDSTRDAVAIKIWSSEYPEVIAGYEYPVIKLEFEYKTIDIVKTEKR